MAKRVTITNSDKGSQLLIPTSEWTDSGIYTITVKNIAGQESFNVEVRVTGQSPYKFMDIPIYPKMFWGGFQVVFFFTKIK